MELYEYDDQKERALEWFGEASNEQLLMTGLALLLAHMREVPLFDPTVDALVDTLRKRSKTVYSIPRSCDAQKQD